MARPRLLLVPSFTELEWGIRDELERWAEVASFDMPGIGSTPLPPGLEVESPGSAEMLAEWRRAGIERGWAEVEDRGWSSFFVVGDSYGSPTAVQLAARRPDAIAGLALGHASLDHGTEGPRAAVRGAIWDAFATLARQGNEAFIRYGIAQMTRGGISDELAAEMFTRFPEIGLLEAIFEAHRRDPEPLRDDLETLAAPLLFAKHDECLARTDEGFEDIVAAFPAASTVICPEACAGSPAFATAIRELCGAAADRT